MQDKSQFQAEVRYLNEYQGQYQQVIQSYFEHYGLDYLRNEVGQRPTLQTNIDHRLGWFESLGLKLAAV